MAKVDPTYASAVAELRKAAADLRDRAQQLSDQAEMLRAEAKILDAQAEDAQVHGRVRTGTVERVRNLLTA